MMELDPYNMPFRFNYFAYRISFVIGYNIYHCATTLLSWNKIYAVTMQGRSVKSYKAREEETAAWGGMRNTDPIYQL